MISYPPVLSLGKSSEEQADQYAAGSVVISGVIDTNFPIGTHVWSSDNDYSNTQYRGDVLVSGSGQITVRHAASGTSSSPSRVWKATSQWVASWDISAPRSWRDLGVETQRTGDGTVHRTQTMTAIEYIRLTWQRNQTSLINSFWSWVQTAISDGVDRFTLSFYDFRQAQWRLCTVVLNDPQTNFSEVQIGLGPQAIEMIVQAEGSYL